MENKADMPKQSFGGRVFQRIINAAVYTALRPDVKWEDDALKSMRGTPLIFVCNHTHHFDGVFASAVLNRYRAYTLVMRKWYDKKYIGGLIKLCRCVSIDLGAADAGWYRTCTAILQNGGSVIIFPEGGIAREDKMIDFKPGAAMLSVVTGAPLVPAAIYGSYNILHGHRQRMLIGKPITSRCPDNVRRSRYCAELIKDAEREVRRLYGILQARYGDLGTYRFE